MNTMPRALLALTFVTAALGAASASADSAPPPTTMRIVGQRSSVTTVQPPDHATFELRNVGPDSIDVFLFRAIARDGRTNHPMPIARVLLAGGGAAGRTLTVPAGSTTSVTVFFDLPRTLRGRGRWEIDLRVTTTGHGGYRSEPATIARAHRDARRKLAAGLDKRRS